MIKVVAALIKKDGKILLAKRATGDETVLGRWEFPGGKVEKNEDEFCAIEREIKEEFKVQVIAKTFLVNNVCKYPNKVVDLRLYECEYLKGEFNLCEHSEIVWANKEELITYDLALADIPLAEFLMKN